MTWNELITSLQTSTGDTSAAALVEFKKDLNTANRRINAALNNYYNRKSKSANLVADQQYYQLPADCIQVIGVNYLESASRRLPLNQIRSEYQWRELNQDTQSSNSLLYFFVKGADELGLFPTPSTATANGLIIYYKPKGYNFSQDDYSTGTISLTQGSTTVTGTGTTFTNTMVGRALRVTDGTDGYDYKIASYTNGTSLELEEPFVGISGSGKTYLIGESPVFPVEYHDTLLDYPLMHYFEMNNNPERAKYHKNNFDTNVNEIKELYASSSTSAVIDLDGLVAANPWSYQITSVAQD